MARAACVRRPAGGLLKDHAVAVSHHDPTLNNGAATYTVSVDSTRTHPLCNLSHCETALHDKTCCRPSPGPRHQSAFSL